VVLVQFGAVAVKLLYRGCGGVAGFGDPKMCRETFGTSLYTSSASVARSVVCANTLYRLHLRLLRDSHSETIDHECRSIMKSMRKLTTVNAFALAWLKNSRSPVCSETQEHDECCSLHLD
jgi:hypothetical protein